MKILMVQDTFLPKLGGAEIHVSKLVKALSERGYKVNIATATPGKFMLDGIRVYRFPYLQSQGKQAVLALPFYLPLIIRLVAYHDIVHGHYTALFSAIFGLLTKVLRRPFVVTLHGYGTLDSSVQGNLWLQKWRQIAFYAADRVIATSPEMAEVASQFVTKNHIVLIPNGVDTDEFIPTETLPVSPIRIATVRRLVPKNGVQYLVEALPYILRQSPKPIECWIVGDGRLRGHLETRVKELGLASKVKFLGELPNEKIKKILSLVHIVVFPSSAESISIAALEAMAMGKPVVASAVGGYPMLLGNNERGLLVQLFDRVNSDYNAPLNLPTERIQVLAEAIVQLIKNPELATALGMQARAYVKREFDWRIIAMRVEAVYRELIKKA